MGFPFTVKSYMKLADTLENEGTGGLEEVQCISR